MAMQASDVVEREIHEALAMHPAAATGDDVELQDKDEDEGYKKGNDNFEEADPVQSVATMPSEGCVCPPKVVEAVLSLQDNTNDKAGFRVLRLAWNRLKAMCHLISAF
ncbi:MAG: hypothetical protein M1813_000668 [Trichoglossum hirsutum]|nr:MAG: hypothetical protein M1813_000668 [Trichoglossum hirsutum]